MSAAAVILIRQKRLVRRFREAGATDPERAVMLEALGERQSWIFNRMARHGAFLRLSNARFYLEEQVADKFLRLRRKRAALVLGCLLLVLLLLLQLGSFGR